MKTIKGRIGLIMAITVGIAMFALASAATVINYLTTVDTLKETLVQDATVAARSVSMELQVYKQAAENIGMLPDLSDPAVSIEEKQSLLDHRLATGGFARGNILDRDGMSILTGTSYAERDYYQAAIKGDTFVSQSTISKVTGEFSIIIAAPLWADGIDGGEIVGVVYVIPQETFLCDIAASLRTPTGGTAFIVDQNGTTIGHDDADKVKSQENIIEVAKKNAGLQPLADTISAVIRGETGFSKYTYAGVAKFVAYAPIEGTSGWGIETTELVNSELAGMYKGMMITTLMTVVFVLISIASATHFGRKISKPVAEGSKRLNLLASEGDLTSPVPTTTAHDETGTLLSDMAQLMNNLKALIDDISRMLGEMARGNFDVSSDCPQYYIGGFADLLTSVDSLTAGLSRTLGTIKGVADQVSNGADELSQSAQSLAQGSTEQASAVDELAGTIDSVNSQTGITADNARQAADETVVSQELMTACTQHMNDLVVAMDSISTHSEQISSIVKTIEDIAKQTNILAINAAVEAARAGEAGKGFAVVAEEIRNLAGKSQDAVRDTTELIEELDGAVAGGQTISAETAENLGKVAESAAKVIGYVELISKATGEQAESISQVALGIDQISQVVQTNSATSEETAATSTELTNESRSLKKEVSRFTLKH